MMITTDDHISITGKSEALYILNSLLTYNKMDNPSQVVEKYMVNQNYCLIFKPEPKKKKQLIEYENKKYMFFSISPAFAVITATILSLSSCHNHYP